MEPLVPVKPAREEWPGGRRGKQLPRSFELGALRLSAVGVRLDPELFFFFIVGGMGCAVDEVGSVEVGYSGEDGREGLF